MSAPPPPPKGGGMSLYANLLNPKADASASVSGAPVLYDSANKDDAAVKKDSSSALRFQPIRRPQTNQKKPAKLGFPKAIPPSSNAANATSSPNETKEPTSTAPAPPPPPLTSTPPPGQIAPSRTTLADWAAENDDDYLWGAGAGEKRQRGGRRAKKKKQQQLSANRETDWDEIYDPARPTSVEEYLRSDERIREVQEWKAILYAHRRRRRGSYNDEDSDEDSEMEGRAGLGNQFAPPADYSFAPPPMSPPSAIRRDLPAATIANDATGDDAYARRLAMPGMGVPPPPPANNTPPPPLPSIEEAGATISRGPVRYEAPPQPLQINDDTMDLDDENNDDDDDDDDVNVNSIVLPLAEGENDNTEGRASNRPGQAGFAQRLMSKYGWTAGSGLGASSSGIVNPLQVKLEKRRRRPDAEGGGYADPANRARIIAPKTSSANTNPSAQTSSSVSDSKFGPMSEVILLANMLHNMPDLQSEIADGLGQEIGQECGDKYGRVERLYIDVEGKQVFIKFTDAVSALRAVNALEGRVFNGNIIKARFWNEGKFERGEYT